MPFRAALFANCCDILLPSPNAKNYIGGFILVEGTVRRFTTTFVSFVEDVQDEMLSMSERHDLGIVRASVSEDTKGGCL
jgi:hypothetical protein